MELRTVVWTVGKLEKQSVGWMAVLMGSLTVAYLVV